MNASVQNLLVLCAYEARFVVAGHWRWNAARVLLAGLRGAEVYVILYGVLLWHRLVC